MKILVTGGAGFIGSHLVDALIKKKHQVFVIDNLVTGKKANINPKAKFYKLDIGAKLVAQVFKKHKPQAVFHLAAQMDVRHSTKDPAYDAQVNILGSLNILNNCLKYKVKKFIFSSSGGAIYGEAKKIPTSETQACEPLSPYGASKLAIENYLFYFRSEGLDCVSLRYANVYGPRQLSTGEAGVVAIFTDKLLKNKQPVINGSGKQTRDYIYVDDVVQANLLALNKKVTGSFNIGTGKETDVNVLFKKLVKLTKDYPSSAPGGSGPSEKHAPAKPGEQMRSCLDFQKSKKVLGWEPRVKLDEGLNLTVNWFDN